MKCVACARDREPSQWGWVVVLTRPDEPRMTYCPECFARLIGIPSEDDESDDELTPPA